jgi:hypothetical protein
MARLAPAHQDMFLVGEAVFHVTHFVTLNFDIFQVTIHQAINVNVTQVM